MKRSKSVIFSFLFLVIFGISQADALIINTDQNNLIQPSCQNQSRDSYPLPFLEQWNTGSFETNNWIIEGENWSINGQEGLPDPCAQFTWDPIRQNYQVALESPSLLADSLTEGQIYLDYIIKLDNVLPTGTEKMLVQVWNADSLEWVTVSTYSNVDGSFEWLSEHIDITNQAMGKVFKIRFAATGENSLDILGWYADNIHVYRQCKAPYYLTVESDYIQGGIVLEWESPFGPAVQLLEWDDGVNSGNSIGTGDQVEFDCAARWDPWQLYDYDGFELTQVSFFPSEAQAEYNIRVWTGDNAESLVIDQPVYNPVVGQWNEVTLSSPLIIDVYNELWIGYHVNTETGYPAGVDNGPAIDGYGNMMNFEGWQTLLEINPGLDYNWNIKANIQREFLPDTVSKYAIYRSDAGEPYYFREYSELEEFLDDSAITWENCPFCYYVTAIYSSDLDWCESGPSNESCMICEGIKEEINLSDVRIYPNPASDVLFIESAEKVESVTIFDSRGGTVEQWNGGTVEIPVRDLVPGLYLVRMVTGKGVVGRKVIIR
jgi:hypothetical protein